MACRYEAQLQMQRMRLASDKDCAQEQVQAALAEEHKAHRAALDRLEQVPSCFGRQCQHLQKTLVCAPSNFEQPSFWQSSNLSGSPLVLVVAQASKITLSPSFSQPTLAVKPRHTENDMLSTCHPKSGVLIASFSQTKSYQPLATVKIYSAPCYWTSRYGVYLVPIRSMSSLIHMTCLAGESPIRREAASAAG